MISFVCPFCAKAFTVQDALAGHSIKCSACGADVAVPAAAPAPPPMMAPPPYVPAFGPSPQSVVESANRRSWIALVLGFASVAACCLTAIPSVAFGIGALSKGGVDPALLKPAKSRAIFGILLAIVLSIVNIVAISIFAAKAKEQEIKDLAAADAHYEAKRWNDAKPLYEKHKTSGDTETKAKCLARLGRIEFELGNPEAAKSRFEEAWKAKNDFSFAADNPEVQKLWDKTVRRMKRGTLGFETDVAGEKQAEITVQNWRREGKRVSFDVSFRSDPKKLKVELRMYGEDEQRLEDYFFWNTEDLPRQKRLETPDYAKWDDVWKVVLYVETKP